VNEKKKYRAKSSGLIARVGNQEYYVEAGKVYEWGDEEAQIYLRNAPENFEIAGAAAPAIEELEPEPEPEPEPAPKVKFIPKKKGGK